MDGSWNNTERWKWLKGSRIRSTLNIFLNQKIKSRGTQIDIRLNSKSVHYSHVERPIKTPLFHSLITGILLSGSVLNFPGICVSVPVTRNQTLCWIHHSHISLTSPLFAMGWLTGALIYPEMHLIRCTPNFDIRHEVSL